MKLYLQGHDCSYAAQQMLLTIFPDERPEYPEGEPEGDCAVISFKKHAKHAQASCTIYRGDEKFFGTARVAISELYTDDLSETRHKNRLVKLAFYRAGVKLLGKKPAWGSITGIRPATLMAQLLHEGNSPRRATSQFAKIYDSTREKAQLCLSAAQMGETVRENLRERDICLYIGIPFCPTRCAYCSFVSQAIERSIHLIEPFLQTLLLEMEATAKIVRELDLRILAVYVGGGTPTTLSASQLDIMCQKLHECFDLSSCSEITVEAGRPDTVSRDKIETLLKHGVTRLSINPQTMNNDILKTIGRNHTAEDILSAVDVVRDVGDFVLNMDLIAGLPHDDGKIFSQTLDSILEIAPQNITVHTLAHKKGSALLLEGNEHTRSEIVGAMLEETATRLTAAGYEPYYLYRQKFTSGGFENIGWCKKGEENLYNVCIMEELCTIVAMGGGASTKMVSGGGKIKRFFCPKYPTQYIDAAQKVCDDKAQLRDFYENVYKW